MQASTLAAAPALKRTFASFGLLQKKNYEVMSKFAAFKIDLFMQPKTIIATQ